MSRREGPQAWDHSQGPRAPRPWPQLVLGQWPLAVVLLTVAAGVAWAGLGHWKRGSFVIGVGFCIGFALRLLLPEAKVGLLGVRARWVDLICLGVFGLGTLALALVVPPQA